ncbi:hypothetical protein [Legionella israelensis]|uniref:TIGR03758 family integrating conjugative element protein n=1 Tax=Legionella israelensis TaxID=454 RepID=A0A0W0WIA2_9GAMM|nr:hypothetical protein [Legionella israelensis]KTD32058.1 hypothetical protein Lisr_0475 [Legionella israelensis]QBS10369.1 hypothetical protein E4T55_11155 [Legionella israelensis]SCY34086.1 hypothetical protein SAMN02746069_02101 [Legionella israelensis DSM 19235]STX59978.1 Uncharacterised protein [Legionella israelensis]
MSKDEIAKLFAASFQQSSQGVSVNVFSSSIRFIAISMVILAVMWSVNHFLGSEEKEQDGFLHRLGSRLIRLVIGLMVFILLLYVRG